MKKYKIMFLTLIFLMLFPSIIVNASFTEENISVETAVKDFNRYMNFKYGTSPNYIDINKVNKEVFVKYGALVYGEEHGTYDPNQNEYRYLGTIPNDPAGSSFTNPRFRHDAWVDKDWETRNYYTEPWKKEILHNKYPYMQIAERRWQKDAGLWNQNLQEALEIDDPLNTNGSFYDGQEPEWSTFMEVLQPPSDYADGFARIFHRYSEKPEDMWYATFRLLANNKLSTIDNIRIDNGQYKIGENRGQRIIEKDTNRVIDPKVDKLVIGKDYIFSYYVAYESGKADKTRTNNAPIYTNVYTLYNDNTNTSAPDKLEPLVKDTRELPYLEKVNTNSERLDFAKYEESKMDTSKIANYQYEFQVDQIARNGSKVEKGRICAYLPYQYRFYMDFNGDTLLGDNASNLDDISCVEFQVDNSLANTMVAHSPNNSTFNNKDKLEVIKDGRVINTDLCEGSDKNVCGEILQGDEVRLRAYVKRSDFVVNI